MYVKISPHQLALTVDMYHLDPVLWKMCVCACVCVLYPTIPQTHTNTHFSLPFLCQNMYSHTHTHTFHSLSGTHLFQSIHTSARAQRSKLAKAALCVFDWSLCITIFSFSWESNRVRSVLGSKIWATQKPTYSEVVSFQRNGWRKGIGKNDNMYPHP